LTIDTPARIAVFHLCGLKERSTRAHHFISRFQEEKNKMEIIMVEILWAKIILQEQRIVLKLL
jgi:hypothetical protein